MKARLSARDSAVELSVHSDPEHKLLPTTPGVHSLFVKKEFEASTFGGTFQDYVLVQPALVVVDRHGAIVQMWSWMTEPLRDVVRRPAPDEELTPVGLSGEGLLHRVRPDSNDLGPSLKEGRPVKLLGLE